MSLERRADDMFRRAAKEGMGLDLLVAEATVAPMPRAAAFEQIPDLAAWYLLSNGGAALGLALLDGEALDAIIEFETLGRVTSAARGDRPVTRIDARVGQRLLDQALDALAAMLPNSPELDMPKPFLVMRPEWDRPTLDLLLDLPTYNVMTVKLDFGPGGKTGQVQLWLPGSSASASRNKGPREPNPIMQEVLADVESRLDTRVKGVRIPLSTLMRLTVGSEIRLPADCLTRVVIMEPSGREVLSARLGQLNGARALRVTGPARARRNGDGAAMTEGIDAAPEQVAAGSGPSPVLSAPEPAMPEPPMPEPMIAEPEPLMDADMPAMAEPMALDIAMDDLPGPGGAAGSDGNSGPGDDGFPTAGFEVAPITLD